MYFKKNIIILIFLSIFFIINSNAQSKMDTLTLVYMSESDKGYFFQKNPTQFSIPTSIDPICNKEVFIHSFVTFNQENHEDSLIFDEIQYIFVNISEINISITFKDGQICSKKNDSTNNIDESILYNDIYLFIKTLFFNSVLFNEMTRKDKYYILDIEGIFIKK